MQPGNTWTKNFLFYPTDKTPKAKIKLFSLKDCVELELGTLHTQVTNNEHIETAYERTITTAGIESCAWPRCILTVTVVPIRARDKYLRTS